MKCPYFSNVRKQLIKVDCKRINCLQMKKILICKSTSKLKCLAGFIKHILSSCTSSANAKEKVRSKNDTLAYIPKLKTRSGRVTQKPTVLDL